MTQHAPILLAHAFGARYDLPIPLALFVVGGAAVVVVSFLLVLPRNVAPATGDQPALHDRAPLTALRQPWTGISLIGLLLLTGCGLLGSDVVSENIVPTAFWLLVWIAVPLSCGLLGDWTRCLNPFANLARLADRRQLRSAVLTRREPLAWPARLGWWPAVALFFVLACAELIFNLTATRPHVVALGFLAYAAANVLLGLLFGQTWVAAVRCSRCCSTPGGGSATSGSAHLDGAASPAASSYRSSAVPAGSPS